MVRSTLPTHATLIDPSNGRALVAIGRRRNGAPIWPMLGAEDDKTGGDKTDPPVGKPGEGGKPEKTDDGKPLGEPGLKALQAERDRADTAAKERDALKAELEKRDREKLTESERKDADLNDARAKLTLAEAKAAKYEVCAMDDIGLPISAARYLTGNTVEEIKKSAEQLIKDFPSIKTGKTDDGKGGLPPAGGAGGNTGSGGNKLSGRDAGKAEAERRFSKKD